MIFLNPKVYEVLALAMRYFFTILGIMIVWRSYAWLRKDRRLTKRRLKQLPDAGTIGIFTMETDSGDLQAGDIIPVPHEGVLGFLRTCDVVVPADDIANAHLDFTFADGQGLFIYPRRGCDAMVDGVPLSCRRDSRQMPMQHGSVLQIGQAVLRLGVFAGLNVGEVACTAFPPVEDKEVLQPETPLVSGQPFAFPPAQPLGYPQMPSPYAPMTPPPAQSPYPPTPWQGGDGDAP